MRTLLIRYRDSAGEITERRISDPKAQDEWRIVAHCHLRGAERTFTISGIEQVVDAETGELIDDIRGVVGLPCQPPSFGVMPSDPPPATPDEAQARRRKDKYDLYKRFHLPMLQHHAQRQLFALFGDRCFKCQAGGRMHVDHVVPSSRGGRYYPGNLCALCPQCNNRKRDSDPREFFGEQGLQRLQPLLEAQKEIFRFRFDANAWNDNRAAYLRSLRVPVDWIDVVVVHPGRRFYFDRDGNTVIEPVSDGDGEASSDPGLPPDRQRTVSFGGDGSFP